MCRKTSVYLLDTNVISEMCRIDAAKGSANVARWLASVNGASLYVSAVTMLEQEYGVLLMERRDTTQGRALRRWIERWKSIIEGRCLPVDSDIAIRAAGLHVPNPRPNYDALIAATALAHDLCVVTRNIADFDVPNLAVINPWETK